MSAEMLEICESLGVPATEVERDYFEDSVELECAVLPLDFN